MTKRQFKFQSLSPKSSNPRENQPRLPSLVTPGGSTAAKEIPQYTGTEMIGISIIHKSCLQPVFNKQAAIDASNMRR